jgi:hypothetical protein
MNLTRHCTLCENGIMSLEKGMTCKLTKRKPDFEITCPDIKLGEKFQKKLERAILELENIHRYKRSSYLTFYFLIIIGFSAIIGSAIFIEWTYSRIYMETKILVIGAGISTLGVATYKLSRFKKKFETAEYTKNKIDLVLDTYGISYTYHFDIKEEIHGAQHINLNLEFKNWKKSSTTASLVIDLKNEVHY